MGAFLLEYAMSRFSELFFVKYSFFVEVQILLVDNCPKLSIKQLEEN